MFHNIKADIIYYKTPTDFELEFNLCGCCRMRLLSDKMQDKKSFVHSLARAVSRSSVILVAGPLFSDNGTIQTVTEALNTITEKVDNAAYGITDEQEIKIIKDATPLVTPEGVFGGCIIESGPQTMILLTDNKDIRKTIMKNLIHPYIEELYSAEAALHAGLIQGDIGSDNNILLDNEFAPDELPNPEEAPLTDALLQEADIQQEPEADASEEQPDSLEETEPEISEDIIEATEEAEDEATVELIPEEKQEIPEAEEVPETEPLEDNGMVDLFIKPTKLEREDVDRFTREYSEKADVYDYDGEDYYESASKRNVGFSLAVLIISVILLLVVVVLCYCIFYVPANQGISPVSNLQEIFNTMFG